jgi:hypothetical protein
MTRTRLADFLRSVPSTEVRPDGWVYMLDGEPFAHLHLLSAEYAFFWLGIAGLPSIASYPSVLVENAIGNMRRHGYFAPDEWSLRVTCSYRDRNSGRFAELRRDDSGRVALFQPRDEQTTRKDGDEETTRTSARSLLEKTLLLWTLHILSRHWRSYRGSTRFISFSNLSVGR